MIALLGTRWSIQDLIYRECQWHREVMRLLGQVMHRNPGGIPGVRNTTLFHCSKFIRGANDKWCPVTSKYRTLKIESQVSRKHKLANGEKHERIQDHKYLDTTIGGTQLGLPCPKPAILLFHSHLYNNRSLSIHSSVISDLMHPQGCMVLDHIRHLSTSGYKSYPNSVVIDMMAPKSNTATQTEMVPGKGRPPEPPTDCCGAGCVDCVWIPHIKALMDYYPKDKGALKAKEAIETISDPQMRLFIKIELGL